MGSEESAVGEMSVASEFFLLGEDKRRDPDADCVKSQRYGFLISSASSKLCTVIMVSTEGCLSASLNRDGVSLACSFSTSLPLLLPFSPLAFLRRLYTMQVVTPSVYTASNTTMGMTMGAAQ